MDGPGAHGQPPFERRFERRKWYGGQRYHLHRIRRSRSGADRMGMEVHISMGTVNQNKDFYRSCIHALGKTDYQVIISMGTNTDHFDNVPENIELYDHVDQMAVLSIADAFVTHCGMNSASEGLYFGVPLILFPQTPEQDAVAKRTEELGAGLRLPSIREEDILKSLARITEERDFRQGAEKIAESFKNAGGIKEAVAFIERVPGNGAQGRFI